jgi:A/G-specific adenine glycosylase
MDPCAMVDTVQIRQSLLQWYHANRRILPWREEPTPYRVWVSEIMLQQTQVATVIDYFERFMATFPTLQDLAHAEESEVLTQWSGLGYYRRARLLHRGIRTVVSEHDGSIPTTAEALGKLPGIGRYTAAAIASIAFGEAAAVLDGNVIRVLTRIYGIADDVGLARTKTRLWALAEGLLNADDPSSHNQAMMELGALVCSPKTPRCDHCPVQGQCIGYRAGTPTAFPRKEKRTKAKAIHGVCGVLKDKESRLLVARRPDNVLLGGLWEFPSGTVEGGLNRENTLRKAWADRMGGEIELGNQRTQVKHVFTHRHLTLDVFDITQLHGELTPRYYTDVRWVRPDDLERMPLSSLLRKVVAALESDP